MKYSISAKRIELVENDHKIIDKKLSRIQKYLSFPYEVALVISRDSHHRKGNVISSTVKIMMGKTRLYAQRQGETLMDALDETVKAITNELKRFKQKGITQKRKGKY